MEKQFRVSSQANEPPPHPLVVWFKPHLLAFGVANAIALFAGFAMASSSLPAWTLITTATALVIHWLAARTISVDDDWVEDRTQTAFRKTYERGNFDGILDDAGNRLAPNARPRAVAEHVRRVTARKERQKRRDAARSRRRI
ncbi:MAG: hypothetical protein AAFY53_01275 [Pseudomonadota bacterium]